MRKENEEVEEAKQQALSFGLQLEVFPEWKRSTCVYCRAGVPMRGGFRPGHNLANAPECTAPDPEDYIPVLEARISELEAKLKEATHG